MRKKFLIVVIVLGAIGTGLYFVILSTRKGHSLISSERKGYADVMSVDSRPASVMQREQRMVSESEIQRETGSSSQLVVVPESLMAQIGSVARFNCTATNEEPVYWTTKPYGSQQEHDIYIGEKPLVEEYGRSGRFSVEVDRTVRRYDLVIKDVKQSDAGVYICIDERGFGKEASAELIVWSQF